ncbi:MAG: TcfC E-set like domain-containing protein [Sphingomicrobium sp.]
MAATSNVSLGTTGTPLGFSELESAHEALVDVYFGGRKVGEALATTRPGLLRFRSPRDVLASLPRVISSPEITAAFGAELPTNSNAVCSSTNADHCGIIEPKLVAIIYDEDRFRVDVFVNPNFLETARSAPEGYLPTPDAALSLTNAVGLTASGTIGGPSVYNFQNRTIVGLGNARLRANTSLASRLGLVVDDLVAEIDRRDLRYSAGLFWTPGSEFTGQRRILGAGVGTQFDTSADQESLHGTPMILFLARPARVELLVDGRLVGSRSYAAGNNELDTSGLSDGSYSVLLRIEEGNGNVREERRFFVKNAQIAPIGHPIFHAYAGTLANTERNRPLSASSTFYYQLGTAWRLNNNFALDVAALGTQHKAMVQAGGWFIKGNVRLRAAALASTSGDSGALVQVSTGGHGPLNINFDIRRIWSHDGGPLIPLPVYASTFDTNPATGVQLANGSYVQATGSLGLRIENGFLSVVGSYRKDRNFRADYSIGPSVSWPVVSRDRLQVVLEASAQRTRTTTAAFAGARILVTSGHMSMTSTLGRGFEDNGVGAGGRVSRAVSNFTGQYSHETDGQTQINLEGGLDRNISASSLHAGGIVAGQFGNLRADVLHQLEGRNSTQYDLAFQSGMALGGRSAILGARNPDQSAVIVSLGGDRSGTPFTILIDDVARGRVRVGERMSFYLPAYRTYKVRLVPTEASATGVDGGERSVTLYPGNVHPLSWRAETYITVFAQAVGQDRAPIANALVQSRKGIAQTDENGYFQVDVGRDDPITIASKDGPCHVNLGKVAVKNDFASLGKVVCE